MFQMFSPHTEKLLGLWVCIASLVFVMLVGLKAAVRRLITYCLLLIAYCLPMTPIGHAGRISAVRLTAIFLVLAFIIPGFFISDTYKTSAKSVSIQPSAPIAAPPEAFSIGGGNAGRGECVSILDCGFGILDFVRADGQIRIPQDSPPGLRRGGRVSRTA